MLDAGGGYGQDIEVLTSEGHSLTILGSNESSTQMIRNELLKGVVSFDQDHYWKCLMKMINLKFV